MSDYELCKINKISDLHIFSARNCTLNFDFDSFFEKKDENQLLEFFITPKQVIIVYTGDVPNIYHLEIACKLMKWITKGDYNNLKAVEVDVSTGKFKSITPMIRNSNVKITSDMLRVVELIYKKIKGYDYYDYCVEPLENLMQIVTISDDTKDIEEPIIGVPIDKYINDMSSVYKR